MNAIPQPPDDMKRTVGGIEGFERIGRSLLTQLIEKAGLKSHHHLVDVGCGCGRLAIPLTEYLTTGTYTGIEINATMVAWCQEHITRAHPTFVFRHLDVFNGVYNPNGRTRPEDARLDVEDGQADIVALFSVFTHVLMPVVRRYLSECARILKPSGWLHATYFLADAVNEPGRLHWFPFRLGSSYVWKPDRPEAAVAQEDAELRTAYEEAGLPYPGTLIRGTWAQHRGERFGQQDVLITQKGK